MSSEKGFRELKVWQESMALVEDCYRLSARFPAEERYGLTAQLRRAAVSTPSNIAEGQGRGTASDFAHFLDYASGSLSETETQLEIACRLTFLQATDLDAPLQRVRYIRKMLNSLKAHLRKSQYELREGDDDLSDF